VATWLRIRDPNFHKVNTRRSARGAMWSVCCETEPCPSIQASGIRGARIERHWIEDDGMATWYASDNSNGFVTGKRFSIDEPALTIMAAGMGGDSLGHWHIHTDGRPDPMLLQQRDRRNGKVTTRDLDLEPAPTVTAGGSLLDARAEPYEVVDEARPPRRRPGELDKPPYRVPLIAEVRAMAWNGFTVASTFAGAGGSSTGYRMAGFKVGWASEFVPIAQESYRANMDAATTLDGRDVKLVKAEDILKALGIEQGELDVFDGSPPCQAFSTAGKRAKG
jgi:hypothetical protein